MTTTHVPADAAAPTESTTHHTPPAATEKHSAGSGWLRFFGTIAFLLVVVYIVLRVLAPDDFWMSATEQERVRAALKAGMPHQVELAFKTLHVEAGGGFPQPHLVYDGGHSTIIDTAGPEHWESSWTYSEMLVMDVLAKTEGGRYFTVRYTLSLGDLTGCSHDIKGCLVAEPLQTKTLGAAKYEIFMSKHFTPELYQRLFGEPAPVRSVPA